MAKALIIYYSRTGNTRKLAELIGEGVRAEGVEADVKDVKDVNHDDVMAADALIVGSPTYYGGMAAEIKKFFDESVRLHGKLDGKIGAAFASSIQIGGGNESTILDILHAMMIHGMAVQGDWQGDHYGPVAIGAPDDRAAKMGRRAGARVANMLKRISDGEGSSSCKNC